MHYRPCARHAPVARRRRSGNGDGGCQKNVGKRASITDRVHCSPNAAEGRSARARSATRIVREREERRRGSGSQQEVARRTLAHRTSLCTFETQPMKIPRTDGCHASRINCIVDPSRQYGQEQARALATQRRKEGKRSKPSNPSQPSSIRL